MSNPNAVDAGRRGFEASLPLREGDMINDRYRVDWLLARGGLGVVFRAMDTRLDRSVALKLLLPKAAKDPTFRARFELESRVAVRIQSDHISRVLDVGTLPEGDRYLVMELLQGQDLNEILTERGP